MTRGNARVASVVAATTTAVVAVLSVWATTVPAFSPLHHWLPTDPVRSVEFVGLTVATALLSGCAYLALSSAHAAWFRLEGPRERRLSVYLALILLVLAVDAWRHYWVPARIVETAHYRIESTATLAQTQEIAEVLEALYAGYGEFFDGSVPLVEDGPAMRIKLFGDREEFRAVNRVSRWAEAFYIRPFCFQCYAAGSRNAHQWSVHEATHQLSAERAGLSLARWLDEGVATYFNTSLLKDGRLLPGLLDPDSYPLWWLASSGPTGDLAADMETGRVIPLRAILTGQGGPDMDREFNRYYLHWWSLVHFLFEYEDGRYRGSAMALVAEGGSLAAFERLIGPVESIQADWYAYYRDLDRRVLRAVTAPEEVSRP